LPDPTGGGSDGTALSPFLLADGRYAYLETDATASTGVSFAVQGAVVDQEAMPGERTYVHGAAWAPDGSAVAVCMAGDPVSLPTELAVWSLPLAPAGPTPGPEPSAALPSALPSVPLPTGLALAGFLYPERRPPPSP
jgi:hypothetical protein